MRKRSKTLKVLVVILLLSVALLGATTAWLFVGKLTAAKIRVLKILPYPVALVNGRPILMKTFLHRLQLAQAFSQKQGQNAKTAALETAVLRSLVQEEESRQMAAQKGLDVSQQELQSEYANFESQFNTQNSQPLVVALSGFSLNAEEFQEQILQPQILKTKLTIWHNQQPTLNPEAYQTIAEIRQKLAAGKTFESLTAAYTEDAQGKQVEGDTGFVESTELLPEVQAGLQNAKEGGVKLIASRYGLHLVKLEEKANSPLPNSSRLHLRQIFIGLENFDSWFAQETKNANIQTFFNFQD
jgi:parvulin-like peptidyl-prolyl isomerase